MVSRFDGKQWTVVGQPFGGEVESFAVFDDGSGPALYAGGSFDVVGASPINRIAKWNGIAWQALGSGITGSSTWGYSVHSLVSNRKTDEPALFAGGLFDFAGGNVSGSIAKWSGPGLPPTIIDQPDDVIGLTHHPVTLSIEVQRPSDASFQWRVGGMDLLDGGNITGATSAVLTINLVHMSNAGVYDCIVSNACGSVISDPATLTVICYGDVALPADGLVNVIDLLALIYEWGHCPGCQHDTHRRQLGERE